MVPDDEGSGCEVSGGNGHGIVAGFIYSGLLTDVGVTEPACEGPLTWPRGAGYSNALRGSLLIGPNSFQKLGINRRHPPPDPLGFRSPGNT